MPIEAWCGSLHAIDGEAGGSHAVGAARSVFVPLGSLVLLRSGESCAALELLRRTSTGDGGAEYRCSFWSDGCASATDRQAETHQGETFEDYRRTWTDEGDTLLLDRGSETSIRCGTFAIHWSLGGESGDWLYLPSDHRSDLRMATVAGAVEDVGRALVDLSVAWVSGSRAHALRSLSLSEEQADAIDRIEADRDRAQQRELRWLADHGDMKPDATRAVFRSTRAEADRRIREVLSAEQRAEFDRRVRAIENE